MLNPARSGGDRANDETFARLSDAGVNVAWSNPKFYVTHEKSIVVDGRSAWSPPSTCVRSTSR
jgi:phosphatidylserine/phosphatidylglycerophosphate/cardiolipin synthase-like enzyme